MKRSSGPAELANLNANELRSMIHSMRSEAAANKAEMQARADGALADSAAATAKSELVLSTVTEFLREQAHLAQSCAITMDEYEAANLTGEVNARQNLAARLMAFTDLREAISGDEQAS